MTLVIISDFRLGCEIRDSHTSLLDLYNITLIFHESYIYFVKNTFNAPFKKNKMLLIAKQNAFIIIIIMNDNELLFIILFQIQIDDDEQSLFHFYTVYFK